jgi:glycosyl transferase family 25
MRSKRETTAADINDLFPEKVCINLDRRPERWKKVAKQFARYGIRSVVRSAGVDGWKMNIPPAWPYSPGHYGCLLSHLAVLRAARNKGVASVLIFEDDCVFDEEFNQKFPHYMKQVPPDWDMLLLGGKHYQEPIKISDNIVRLRETYLTHAYALKHNIIAALIELCEQEQLAVDDYTVELQKSFNCYCFVPDLIWQERVDSDTRWVEE